MKGVTLGSERQHIDHYTLVHHIEPDCESHQDYKGIYDGQIGRGFQWKNHRG